MAFDSANRTGRTVVGLFRDRRDAEQAIGDLRDAGFTRDQIGIAINDKSAQREIEDQTGASAAGKGAAAGAVSGGLVGGIIGLLGSLLVPGLGPIVDKRSDARGDVCTTRRVAGPVPCAVGRGGWPAG